MSPAARVADLRRQIDRHNHLYYVEARSEITDREFDRLLEELQALESQHPELVTPDSPTQRVGGRPVEGFRTVAHRAPMLSIDNTYNPNELREFDARVRKLLGGEPVTYVVELKIDGVAMSLTYENGVLTVGATRGDGERGDDVTHNLRTIRELPLRLRTDKPPALLEVRGEVYMTRADLARLNRERIARNLEPFANPRNSAAGSLKLLAPRLSAERRLRLFSYALGAVQGIEVRTHSEALKLLGEYGFPLNPNTAKFDSIDAVVEHRTKCAERRNDLPYEHDVLVIKVHDP